MKTDDRDIFIVSRVTTTLWQGEHDTCRGFQMSTVSFGGESIKPGYINVKGEASQIYKYWLVNQLVNKQKMNLQLFK